MKCCDRPYLVEETMDRWALTPLMGLVLVAHETYLVCLRCAKETPR